MQITQPGVLEPVERGTPVLPALPVAGERGVLGSITGTPYEIEKALNFSVLVDVRPRIEIMPLARANEAYQKMKSGKAKFRMVLAMARRNGSTA